MRRRKNDDDDTEFTAAESLYRNRRHMFRTQWMETQKLFEFERNILLEELFRARLFRVSASWRRGSIFVQCI